MTDKAAHSEDSALNEPRAPEHSSTRPWRTEGLPKKQPPKRRLSWVTAVIWFLGYALIFGVLTIQDRMDTPQSVSYTEFKAQVANKNVDEVFARGNTIQGELREPAPMPDEPREAGKQGHTYLKFTTERPTFAADDLLGEMSASNATVRATPLVQQRGVLTNLLISMAPFLLLIFFYVWMFKRQKTAMGGGLLGGGARKPVDPEAVRVSFEDVAGIDEVEAEINEVVDFLRPPKSTAGLAPVHRRACCSQDLRALARRCWPVLPPARPMFHSSAPAPRSSSR